MSASLHGRLRRLEVLTPTEEPQGLPAFDLALWRLNQSGELSRLLDVVFKARAALPVLHEVSICQH